MKRLLFATFAFAALAAGCQQIEIENPVSEGSGEAFRLEAMTPDTKTLLDQTDLSVAWELTDELSVIINSSAYKFTKSEDGSTFETMDFTPQSGTAYTYYALYPYNADITSISSNRTNTWTEVPVGNSGVQTQTVSGNSDHIKGQLWGTATGTGTESPSIQMNHLTTLFCVEVTNPSTSPIKLSTVTVTTDAAGAQLCGTFYINTDGSLTASGANYVSNAATLVVTDGTIGAGETGYFWISTAPFSVPSGSNLIINMVDENDLIVSVQKAAPAEGWEFAAGHKRTVGVEFAGAAAIEYMSVTEALAVAESSAVNVEGTVMAKNARGYILADDTNYILVYYGSSTVDDVTEGDFVQISGTTGTYAGLSQITNPTVDKVVSSGTVTLPTPSVLDGAGVDALVAAPARGFIQVTGTLSVSGTNYNLNVDGATAQVSLSYPADDLSEYDGLPLTVTGYFNGASGRLYILYTDITVNPYCILSVSSLTADAAAVDVTFDVKTNVECTITSSDPAFAVLPATLSTSGTVTVSCPENTGDDAKSVTITVSCELGSHEVVINQRSASGAAVVLANLVTDASEITTGKYVILGDFGTSGVYALPNATASGSAPVAVAIADAGIEEENNTLVAINDAYVWQFTAVETGGVTIRPVGDATIGLGCTATNNGLRNSATYVNVVWTIAKSTASNVWNISAIDSGGTNTRYLAGYTTTSWRTYTSATSNQNCAFRIYKLIEQ